MGGPIVMKKSVVAALTMSVIATGATVVTAAAAEADPACTSTWSGAAGAAWTDPANWTPAGVPTRSSFVCVLTAAGPNVTSGSAGTLYARSTSITISRQLSTKASDLGLSDIGGHGTLILNGDASLSGLRISGSVKVDALRVVVVRLPCRLRWPARLVSERNQPAIRDRADRVQRRHRRYHDRGEPAHRHEILRLGPGRHERRSPDRLGRHDAENSGRHHGCR